MILVLPLLPAALLLQDEHGRVDAFLACRMIVRWLRIRLHQACLVILIAANLLDFNVDFLNQLFRVFKIWHRLYGHGGTTSVCM